MLLGWVSLVCGVTWGAASDRLGRRVALALVYLIQASSLVLFTFAPRSALVASAVLFGFTAWSAPAIMAAACGDLLGPRLAPAALGFITLFFGVGQALGPAVAGWLGDAHGSFAPGYLVGAVALLAGAAGTLALRESRAA
jgi:predicted MFS family arabinose efflux permease